MARISIQILNEALACCLFKNLQFEKLPFLRKFTTELPVFLQRKYSDRKYETKDFEKKIFGTEDSKYRIRNTGFGINDFLTEYFQTEKFQAEDVPGRSENGAPVIGQKGVIRI